MLTFLERRFSLSHDELVMLMSLVCDLGISQVVDPLLTCRMTLRAGAIPDLRY
jgi:acetamidase/formamidase